MGKINSLQKTYYGFAEEKNVIYVSQTENKTISTIQALRFIKNAHKEFKVTFNPISSSQTLINLQTIAQSIFNGYKQKLGIKVYFNSFLLWISGKKWGDPFYQEITNLYTEIMNDSKACYVKPLEYDQKTKSDDEPKEKIEQERIIEMKEDKGPEVCYKPLEIDQKAKSDDEPKMEIKEEIQEISEGKQSNPEPLSTSSARLFHKWKETYKYGYISHAIWNDNVEKVFKEGILSSAEERLRKGEKVEYEASTYNDRQKLSLPLLNEEEIRELKELRSYLTKEEKEEFKKLQKTINIAENKKLLKEFYRIRKEYENTEKEEKLKKQQDLNELKKQLGPYMQYKYMDLLNRGINFIFNDKYEYFLSDDPQEKLYDEEINQGVQAQKAVGKKFKKPPGIRIISIERPVFIEKVEELCQKYGCDKTAILISLDEALKENSIDCYLYKKFKKGFAVEKIMNARHRALQHLKLNPEIRMAENTILWAYGDVVILKGFKSQEDENAIIQYKSSEFLTCAPWQDSKGKFFSFNLKDDPSILILAPKQYQEYQAQYSNLVIIEELNSQQSKELNIPQISPPHKSNL